MFVFIDKYFEKMVIAFILGMYLISYNIWLPSEFPSLPLINIPGAEILSYIFFFSIVFGLSHFFITSDRRSLLFGIVSPLLTTVLDVNRLELWTYIAIFLLLIFFFIEKKEEKYALISLFLAIEYFWAGFNKISSRFFENVIPKFLNEFLNFQITDNLAVLIGLPIIFLEVAAAAILWRQKFKYTLVLWAVVVLHVLISWIFIRWGIAFYAVGVPWNIFQIILLVTIINSRPQSSPLGLKSKIIKMALFTAFIGPILNMFSLWPDLWSFHMHSGATNYYRVFVEKKHQEQLPTKYRKWLVDYSEEYRELRVGHFYASSTFGDRNFNFLAAKIFTSHICKEMKQRGVKVHHYKPIRWQLGKYEERELSCL